MNSTSLTPVLNPKSRQRRRTEAEAVKFLDETLKLPPVRRVKLVKRIRGARQPIREARRIITETLVGHRTEDVLDNSDVQELRVKLLRRDLILDEEQDRRLRALDRRIAERDISKPEFDREAADLLLYQSVYPKSHREQEFNYRRASLQ